MVHNNYEVAIKDQTALIEKSPDAYNYVMRRQYYAIIGHYDLALRNFNEAIEKGPARLSGPPPASQSIRRRG